MTTNRARQMRKTLTTAEARLWLRLKRLRSEGFHFRRQAPFRSYFLDFVCFSRKLVVELDGWRHAEDDHAIHDAVRDQVLQREGFTVLRFWNHQLDRNVSGVMDSIRDALGGRCPTRLSSSGEPPSP